MPRSALYVTPAGRVDDHLRRASLIALWERMARVSLREPIVIADRRVR